MSPKMRGRVLTARWHASLKVEQSAAAHRADSSFNRKRSERYWVAIMTVFVLTLCVTKVTRQAVDASGCLPPGFMELRQLDRKPRNDGAKENRTDQETEDVVDTLDRVRRLHAHGAWGHLRNRPMNSSGPLEENALVCYRLLRLPTKLFVHPTESSVCHIQPSKQAPPTTDEVVQNDQAHDHGWQLQEREKLSAPISV
eukprot:CAMPEP_0206629438 /NCGR_PEP_ID=MMETSP0325_2-20121206/67041_1 /ASSEMBLY_ACC=CAM_ASM_000347 /TAXON_ID=2866 /ORGANISM="Crypthecodinium cohnii, Strain Seligo" /LENGTH=197 /DNA_ID=CAMNT_0054154233 /DNA_START=607 /DNA_END=1199 /DNA_ORIENTATION=-